VAAGKRRRKAWFRSGDHLLIAAAGLLGALGDAAEFPQDQAGIEALLAAAGKGPNGEELGATYEERGAPITYLSRRTTWVAPAGEGRLRIRQRAFGADDLASHVWILGPDGSLGDPETIEGYGVPEDELPAAARAELEEFERLKREAEARRPEDERRNEELRDRHRVDHLRGVVAGPADQAPGAPIVSHVVLYDTGTLVDYLLPRPDETDFDPDEPWERPEVEPPKMTLDDQLGTEFFDRGGQIDRNGEGPLRCRREFAPAIPTEARRLGIEIGEMRITIELGLP
jgi:hypothetical protein